MLSEEAVISSVKDLADGSWGERVTCVNEIRYTADSIPYHIYVAKNAFVCGPLHLVFGVQAPEQRVVFKESADYNGWAATQWVEACQNEAKNVEIDGEWQVLDELDEACVLSSPINFGHWHQESLVKVAIMEHSGFRGHYIIADYYLFAESLKLIGIDEGRIYRMRKGIINVKHLYVPQSMTLFQSYFYPQAVLDIRAQCIAAAEIDETVPRIFVSRAPGGKRSIVDEDRLLRLLEKHGFTRFLMEQFSLPKQIGLMSTANVLLGPHGAGMASSMFMKQAGQVYELFSPLYVNPCLLSTCRV